MSGDVVAASVPTTQRAMSVSSCSSSSTASSVMSPAAMTSPLSIPAYSPRPTPPVSTPTSGACALAPKVMPQQQTIISSDVSQVVTGIVTQKEWVIPPRPKPGRKPATDTPPTKRKAQNRAAQRAFRERRAARVNELEDKIKEIEAEHAAELLEAHQEIERLRVGNAELIKENAIWKAEMEKLRGESKELSERAKGYQQEIEQLKRDKEMALMVFMEKVQQVASPPSETELGPDIIERKTMTSPPPPSQVVDAGPLPPRRSLRNRARGTATPSRSSTHTPTPGASKSTGSGGCMKDASGACPCMAGSSSTSKASSPEPSSYYSSEVVIHPLPKRPTSPSTTQPDKRTRLNATLPSSSTIDELETDFTAMYASGGFTSVSTPSSSSCMMADPCGFCSDGTPCVCAEMAMLEEQRQREREKEMEDVEMVFGHDAKLPPLQLYEIDEGFPGSRMGVMHPPNRTKPAIIGTAIAAGVGSSGCGGNAGPGSCALCLKDPLAMLFCQSVASRKTSASASASTSTSTSSGGGCCGGGCGDEGNSSTANGGCCKEVKGETAENRSSPTTASPPPETDKLPPMLPPSNSIYIPCSAAYQTLARHKAFEKASMDDFPGLVRPLIVSDEGESRGGDGSGGCPRVEVGSLRDVLKMLDRRFGKDVL